MRRRNLLPWWIKLFIIFHCFAIIVNISAIAFYLKGLKPNLVAYGFNADNNYPYNLLVISCVLFTNFFVGMWLWFEKDSAIRFAIINSILGIGICIVSLIIDLLNGHFAYRLEIIFLLLFIYKLKNVQDEWSQLKINNYKND